MPTDQVYDPFGPQRPRGDAHKFPPDGPLWVGCEQEVWRQNPRGGTSYKEDSGPLSEFRSDMEILREEVRSIQGLLGRFIKMVAKESPTATQDQAELLYILDLV